MLVLDETWRILQAPFRIPGIGPGHNERARDASSRTGVSVAEPGAGFAPGERFVGHNLRADLAHGRQCGDGGDRPSGRDERQPDDAANRSPSENATDGEDEEADLSCQVEGSAGAERDSGDEGEVIVEVVERGLQTEGEQDDAGNHRQVEIAVGMQEACLA